MSEPWAVLAATATETELRETIRALATLYGWKFFFVRDSRRSPKGWPDVVLVRGEVALFVELKSEKGKVTTEQWAWLHALQTVRRVTVGIWRPSQIEQITAVLRGDDAGG